MKHIILLFIILIMINGSFAFSSLEIKLQSISQKFILGEFYDVINITWKNKGEKDLIIPYQIMAFNYDAPQLIKWYVVGPTRIECKQRRDPLIKWEALAHEILKAGAEKTLNISLAQLGIVDVGSYEIWMEYDSTNLPAYWDDIHITRTNVISNHIKIELNNPIGIDAEIFSKYNNKCNRLTISYDELLKKYPTSTYAGWALLNKYCGATFRYKTAKDMIDDLSLSDEERKIKNARSYGRKDLDNPGWISPIPIAEEYIRLAEAFLKEHPNFSFASLIYSEMALSYMVLHRWQEAYICLDKALKLGIPKNWPGTTYELSREERLIKEAKEELIKRGWAK